MRAIACLLVVGCGGSDTTTISLTVVHVTLSESCESPPCNGEARYPITGICSAQLPIIEPSTRELTLDTTYEPDDYGGIVQVQYDLDANGGWYFDGVLKPGERFDVIGEYDVAANTPLYTIAGDGELIDIDETRLVQQNGRALQFHYTSVTDDKQQLDVIEDHVLDDPRPLDLVLDHPTILDVCCSAGRPADGGLIGLVLIALCHPRGKRRRRRR